MQKYYLITTYYNSKVINKYSIFTIMIIKQTDILTEIRNIILASGYSDVELSEKSGLSKEGIYKIRSGKTTSIRSSNARNILKALDYSLESSLDGLKIVNLLKPVEFRGIDEMLKKTNNAHETLNLLNTQSATINTFIKQIDEKDEKLSLAEEEINKLRSIIESKDKLISKTSQHIPPLEPSRYQCHTKMVIGIPSDADPKEHIEAGNVFINATFLYAELLGYKDNFELINKPFVEVLHPDEFERISKVDPKDLYSSPQELHGKYIYLKLQKKDGSPVFVKSHSTAVEFDGGYLVCTDHIPITEEDYLIEVLGSIDSGVTGEG